MDNSLSDRISRIYAAIDAVEEENLKNLKATVTKTEKTTAFFQDFRGGLSNEQLANIAYSLIDNISYLRDHLQSGLTAMDRIEAK